MDFNKIFWHSALALLIPLTACNQSQKPAQQQAPPVSKQPDTTVKDSSVDTGKSSPASKQADTIAKNNSSPDSNQASTPQDTTAKPNADQQALTLPVLDALFYEPDFVKELRSRLGLPAAKIAQLKTAAHASIRELGEDGSLDTASARTASERYQRRIRAVIGARKAQELLRLVNERYSKGVEGLAPTKPNFVPKDTRIVVNIPAYRMDVFEKGNLLRTFKVSIGYPEFPLPVGMRRADTVIFNPAWTPPDEPWVRGKFAPGRKVSAASKINPLGVIKIPIGMPSLIHGGKPLEKIGRFGSHGCVGLTNKQVLDLAPVILRLGQSELSAEAIQSLEKHKNKTKGVKLPTPVPVDLRYETIVAENGGLRIYRDVYERGTNTLENAKAVLGVYNIKYEQLSSEEQKHLEAALAEMNRDAHGREIATGGNQAPSKDGVPASKLKRAKKGKVTSKVKGHTDVLVTVAALQGKGYPAPVMLNDGRTKHKPIKRHRRDR
jgi:lipoprotein-anchoring transpeptidase ErfK/SrfK